LLTQVKRAKEGKKLYKETCRNLFKNGWTLNDIEEMDIHFYFDLLREDEPEKVYIDEIKLF